MVAVDGRDVVEVLEVAKKIIADPQRWTRGTFVGFRSDNVLAYCSIGAVQVAAQRVLSDQGASVWTRAAYYLDKAAEELKPGLRLDGSASIGLNDMCTHDDVMAMFGRAIAMAKEGVV